MRKNFKKAKTILKAYTEDIPVNEPWFQDRIKICESCEFNSDNVAPEDKDLKYKLREKVSSICVKNRWCRACGCCIDEKASRKEVACGLTELKMAPKWPALEAESPTDRKLAVITDGQQPYTITEELGFIYLDFGKVASDVVDFDFNIFAPTSYEFVSAKPVCGCTAASIEDVDPNHKKFSMRISTVAFSKSIVTVKSMLVEYKQGSVTVRFRMQKVGKDEL
jgi:hypothetical protein